MKWRQNQQREEEVHLDKGEFVIKVAIEMLVEIETQVITKENLHNQCSTQKRNK